MLTRTLDGLACATGTLAGRAEPELPVRDGARSALDPGFARTLELLLRVGTGMCFIGHGAFGVIGKEAWLPYFAIVGIGPDLAHVLMPLVGVVDITIGVLALVLPVPAVLAYGVLWCTWTALLRPLAGEGIWEAAERAGNYGVPLALLMLAAPYRTRSWFTRLRPEPLTGARLRTLFRTAQATSALLLAGHGGLLLFARKPVFLEHWRFVGVPDTVAPWIGGLEIGLACAVLFRPGAALFGGIALWKVATEALFPLTGASPFEWIERGGSYVAPLAAMLLAPRVAVRASPVRRAARAAVRVPVAAALAGGMVLLLPCAADAQLRRPDAALLAELRDGGFVFACRHAITNRDRQDRNVDFDDPSTQRILSDEGERQARRLGELLEALRIPFSEVLTSPYQRTHRTAELAFGRATVERALYHEGTDEARAALLGSQVAGGTNRVLMTHQGILYEALSLPQGSIPEGDCVIVRPEGGRFSVVAQASPDDWARLRP
jgi:phosphohistidine phosphatase SixA